MAAAFAAVTKATNRHSSPRPLTCSPEVCRGCWSWGGWGRGRGSMDARTRPRVRLVIFQRRLAKPGLTDV